MTTESTEESTEPARAATSLWVVGIDGSEDAHHALVWAASAAKGRGVRLRAIGAWHYPAIGMLPVEGGPLPQALEGLGEAIEREVNELVAAASAETGFEIEASTTNGSAAQVILDALDHADLAVVGCRGRGGFTGLLLGSVSHQVAVHARRPVIIVPQAAHNNELRRVVVGVDGSDNSLAALRWALEFAPDSAEVTALGVWDTPFSHEGLDALSRTALREAAHDTFEAAVSLVENDAGAPGRFHREFDVGRPGHALVERGAAADLLVVGERGHRGLLGVVLGSVTTWVIHHLPCAGAVIPGARPPS